MDLIIPSLPLAHFISLKVDIHNINSVGKEVKKNMCHVDRTIG